MTRKLNALALRVPCVDCGAAIAEQCIGVRGDHVMHTHWTRRRDASLMRKTRKKARRAIACAMAMGSDPTVAFLNEDGSVSVS